VGQDLRWPLLLTASSLATGPVGCVGTLLTIGLTFWFERSSTPFEDWYASLFPDHEVQFAATVFEQIKANESDSTQEVPTPFVDILSYGTLAQKQAVILLITKHFNPVLAATLLVALKDSDSAVRVQAATAMTKKGL